MRKIVSVKAPAKINLTLDIVGAEGGFHQLESLVTTIKIEDKITVKRRKDNQITLKVKGGAIDCTMQENNAYKTAVAFQKRFNTCGVDIVIDKKIPIGGGLGGSSADISATLNAMKKLFNIKESMVPLAEMLGSDTVYMLDGGLKVISGRGEKITTVNAQLKLYLLLITAQDSVSASACYKCFDQQGKSYPPVTNLAVKELVEGNIDNFLSILKNDLYSPAKSLVAEIEENMQLLNPFGCAFMTGSGSVVVGAYKTKKQLNQAYKALYPKLKNKLIKTKTN